MPSPLTRFLSTGLVAGLVASALLSAPAQAAPQAPGNFTGHGFDTCVAPSQEVMDTWNLTSPYSAVGIYVSGGSRYCSDADQPHLSRQWVAQNARNGWRFLPIHVGRQAPCFANNPGSKVQKKRMSNNVTTARQQARSEAQETIAALKKFGFGRGSVSYLDIEWYPRTKSCDRIVLEFADAWTEYLHKKGYKSGLYSSGSAAIAAVDEARMTKRKGFTVPDQMWIAWVNMKADTKGGPFLSDAGWKNHKRIHQYHNNIVQTHGGKSILIDKNYLDVGRGSVATKQSRPCGHSAAFTRYPTLRHGANRAEVAALECLLKQRGLLKNVDRRYGVGTANAVNAFRTSMGWSATGVATRSTWTALLAKGSNPRVLKFGSVGASVWRLQRALTAAGVSLRLTGVYDARTVKAVQAYRKARGLRGYTTTDAEVWAQLQSGQTV